MTRRVAVRLLASAALAIVVLVAAVAGLVSYLKNRPAGVPPQVVPASWAQFRTAPMHVAHLKSGKAACKDCHDFEREGFKDPGTDVCNKCHAKETAHPHQTVSCTSCHEFKPNVEAPTCMTCHEKPQGKRPAVAAHMHEKADCKSCHTMHAEPFTKEATCSTCHEEKAPSHAAAPAKGCDSCHAAHQPAAIAAETATCQSCHASPAGPKPAGHASCLGCHQPHVFTPNGAATCKSCHGELPTLAMTKVAAHADCTSCHTPHDPRPELAAKACRGCHTQLSLSHAKGNDDCIGCHTPHPETVAQTKVDAVSCTSCHQNVAFSDDGAHKGGVACESCHEPHHFTPPEKPLPVLCNKCHQREVTLASANKGHADCTSCHGGVTHTPRPGAACSTCHAKEASSAPEGHQTCTNCHDQHRGKTEKQANCPSCHTDRVDGPHEDVKGGCETCHRPHGPGGVQKPPACTTCHQKATLPGLHQMPAHDTCTTCHSSHFGPHPTRETCTSSGCHVDRKTHQPQAQLCNGCHVFRR